MPPSTITAPITEKAQVMMIAGECDRESAGDQNRRPGLTLEVDQLRWLRRLGAHAT